MDEAWWSKTFRGFLHERCNDKESWEAFMSSMILSLFPCFCWRYCIWVSTAAVEVSSFSQFLLFHSCKLSSVTGHYGSGDTQRVTSDPEHLKPASDWVWTPYKHDTLVSYSRKGHEVQKHIVNELYLRAQSLCKYVCLCALPVLCVWRGSRSVSRVEGKRYLVCQGPVVTGLWSVDENECACACVWDRESVREKMNGGLFVCVFQSVYTCMWTTPPIWPPGVPTDFGTDANFKRTLVLLFLLFFLCRMKGQTGKTQHRRKKEDGDQRLGCQWEAGGDRLKGN